VPVRIDLHVHSHRSPDATVPVAQFVRQARSAGLNGFALTDHNTVRGHVELRELIPQHPDLVLLPGVEVSTIEGHLLAYGVTEAPPRMRPLAETITWVRERGGEAVPAHPFRWNHGIGRRMAESAPVFALEVTNGHNSPRANRAAARVAEARHLGTTGGSDAHELRHLGRAFTDFPEGASSADDLLEAIRRRTSLAGGIGASRAERAMLTTRSALLRLRRGLRPI
jgi:predicted metal-dependent phosphoesterase TrpH